MQPGMPGWGEDGLKEAGGELAWDPEGLLAPKEDGLIAKNTLRRVAKDAEKLEATLEEEKEKLYQEKVARREARTPPRGSKMLLIDYLLETHPDDMEWEIARLRPDLDDDFWDPAGGGGALVQPGLLSGSIDDGSLSLSSFACPSIRTVLPYRPFALSTRTVRPISPIVTIHTPYHRSTKSAPPSASDSAPRTRPPRTGSRSWTSSKTMLRR